MGCYATRDPEAVAQLPGVFEVVTDKRELPDVFERLGIGDLLATYAEGSNNEVRYRTWTSGGGWSSESLGPNPGSMSSMTLSSDPGGDQLMLAVLEDNGDVHFVEWDGGAWGDREELESNATSTQLQPYLFVYDQGVELDTAGSSFWFSTDGDENNPGTDGVNSISKGGVLRFGDPDLNLEPNGGTTDGTFSHVFDLDDFADDGDANINGLHYVSRDITIGSGGNTFDLQTGDILFSTKDDEDVTGNNTLAFTKDEIILFRPDTVGDFGSGTFTLLVDDLSLITGENETRGLSLVETDTVVGDATLTAGSFLVSTNGGAAEKDVRLLTLTGVGAGSTSGSIDTLIEGDDIDQGEKIYGIELIESGITLGGTTLSGGQILLTIEKSDSSVGDNAILVGDHDVFALTVSNTTLVSGVGNTAADATLIVDGDDVGLDSGSEKLDALALVSTNQPPVIDLPGGSLAFSEGDGPSIIDATATLSDPDSVDFDTGTLTVDFAANGTSNDRLSINNEGTGFGQIGVSGSDVTYSGTVIGTFAGGTDGSTPLVITLDSDADQAAAQALVRNITFDNVSNTPDTTARTVRFLMADGDGAVSQAVTTTINVTPVNDAPVNTVPGTQTVSEEFTTIISGISVSDVDAGGGTLTTRLQVSSGVLNVTFSGSATISAGAVGTDDLTISGSLADLNNTLSTLTYTGNTEVTGTAADTLTVTTNDGGNTGSGGAQIDVDTVQIDITAVNDPPVLTMPGTQTVNEETSTAINGISVSDADAGSSDITARLQVSSGVLNVTLSGGTTIDSGADGTDDVTLRGSVTDINATLASLTYTGGTDVTGTAADTLTVTVNDQGNTGSGGAQLDIETVQIDITAKSSDITTGLVGHYEFDEGSGSNASDSTGNQDGTLSTNDAPQWEGSEAVGTEAIEFDGDSTNQNSYVEIADNAAQDFGSGEFSVAFWYQADANPTEIGHVIGDFYTSGDSGFAVWAYTSGSFQVIVSDGSAFAGPLDGEFDGEWHHVAIVQTASEIVAYHDGVEQNRWNHSPVAVDSSNDLRIGAVSETERDFDGAVDDVRLYNRVLWAEDVQELYLMNPSETTVTNTNDSGAGSLRQAIINANANPGADVIDFHIPGSGSHVIYLDSALPLITDEVTIDATTEADFLPGGVIVTIDGTSAGGSADGLNFNTGSDGSALYGLGIQNFDNPAVRVADTSDITIGGVDAGNQIINNEDWGILIAWGASDVDVIGNAIGTDFSGTAVLGNGEGITVGNANDITVGGLNVGEGNFIAHNADAGIDILSSAGNDITILGNAIWGNANLGIDIGSDGVSSNDSGDGDGGPNGTQNFPVLSAAVTNDGSTIEISGSLNSNASTDYRIEFFASAAGDGTGHGEGRTYLGYTDVSTDGSGDATFNVGLSADVSPGEVITATATVDNGSGDYGDTSEFASNVTATIAGVITVTTTSDVSDGDTSSIAALLGNRGADGLISLREAILAANSTTNGATPDEIRFDIAGSGPHTIAIDNASVLPVITDEVIIDGWSEPDFAGTPVIELDGSATTGGIIGLRVDGADSVIRGLVIHSFAYTGVRVDASGTTWHGNFIGTDVTGTLDRGNGYEGMEVTAAADNTQIGGTGANEGNIISGNSYTGLSIAADNVVVEGNRIGVNLAGDAVISNDYKGIDVYGNSVTIGGAVAAAANVIGGSNQNAISLGGGSGHVVQGNFIGTDPTGTINLGNNGHGIGVSNNTTATLIGGTGAGEGNTIAFNDDDGIYVTSNLTSGVSILGNAIYGNNELAIDLFANGVNPNDLGDGDTGPNGLQNYPVLATAMTDGGSTVDLTGSLNSTASTDFRIEFFASAAGDGSGHGEAERYLGFVNVTTDASGNASFNTSLAASVAVGEVLTASATVDLGSGNYGDTSELAANVTATSSSNVAPTITDLAGDTLNFAEDDGPSPVDQGGDAQITDADSSDFGGGQLSVSIVAGAVPGEDELGILDLGMGAGQVGVSGSNVYYGGTLVGTLAGGTGGTPLTVAFNSMASPAAATAILQNVTYNNNDSATPTSGARTLRFVVEDGDGGTSADYDATVNVAAHNDAPVLTVPGTQSVAEETAAGITGISVSDVDASGGQITTRLQVGSGVLNVTTWGGATISAGSNGTNDLTILGTIADVNQTLASLSYTGGTDVTGTDADTLTVTVDDQGNFGAGGARQDVETVQIDIVNVNDAPSGSDSTVTTDEETDYVFSASDFGFSDTDGDALAGVVISTLPANGTLYLDADADGQVDAGEAVVATDEVSVADLTAGQLKFKPAANGNGVGYDAFTFRVRDDGGTAGGGVDIAPSAATMTIDVNPIDDPPNLAFGEGNKTYAENAAPTILDGSLTVADPDGLDFDGGRLVVSVSSGGSGDDRIGMVAGGSVTINSGLREIYHGGTLVGTWTGSGAPFEVTFNANADVGIVQDVARQVGFWNNSDDPSTAVRNVQFRVFDAEGNSSNVVSKTVSVAASNDAPEVDLDANDSNSPGLDYAADFTHGAGPVAITDVDALIDDVDGVIQTLTVEISNLQDGVDEVLGWTLPGTISSSYQASLGRVVFTNGGSATNADFEDLLRSLSYDNAASLPDVTARTITIVANDGVADSLTATATVTFAGDATPPSVVANGGQTVTEGQTVGIGSADLEYADTQGPAATRYSVTSTPADGRLEFTDNPGVAVTSFTQADINSARLQYVHDGSEFTSDSFAFQVDDGLGNVTAIQAFNLVVSPVNDAPVLTMSGTQTVNEEMPTSLSGISVSDADAGGSDITARLQVSSGVLNVTLAGGTTIDSGADGTDDVTLRGSVTDINATLASLTYTGGTDVTGTAADTLTVTVNDQGNTGSGGAQSDVDTVQIDITAVNDAPVNTVPGTQSVVEETTTAISGISVNDVDAGGGSASTRLQVVDGVLSVTLSGSATISAGGNGSNDLTITGNLTDLNSTLATLTYTGNTDVTGTAADTLTVTTNDGGNTGSGGAQSDIDTVQIDITAVNDAPVNAVPGTQIVDEETTTAISGISVSDVDAGTGTVSTRLQVGSGVLNVSLSGGATISSGSNGSGDLTISGNLTDLNAVLASLTYTGNADVTGTAADTLTVTTNDGGNTGSGGALSDVDAVQINISAVNDTPVNTVPGTQTVVEEATTPISGISIADVDAGSGTLMTRLQVGNGILNVTLSGSATITAGADGTGDLTISGSLTDLNNTLSSLTYTGNADIVGTAADTLTVTTNDGGNTGSGGAQSDVDAVQINITAVNDAPVNTVPGTQAVAEETATSISGISVADVDAASGTLTTQLQVSNGTLNVSLSGSATISAGSNGSNDLTISGSLADLNATLASLIYTGNVDVVGTAADTLTVTTNDGGNSGSGGALSDVDTVQIDVTTVNDAPVNTVPGTQSVAEETTTAISGISVSDVDAGGGALSTRLQVGSGILNITLSGGATISSGSNGSNDLTISGNLTDLNNTLASLTYTGNTDVTGTAADTLTVTTNDGGNTGSGGAQSDVDSVQININAINDAPVNTVPGTQAVAEETTTTISGISVSDVDAGGGTLNTRLQVSNGILNVTLSGSATITAGADGTGDLTIAGNLADLNATLGSLTYTGDINVVGAAADSLTVTTTDGGNTGTGGVLSDADTVQIDITAVNDAPDNTVPGTQTIAEETSTAISGISVTDVDAGSGSLTTRLQVSSGVLNITLSGSATISAGANGSGDLTISGSLADLNATLASLTYTGNTDVTGTAADTLTVTTNDGGNTGSGVAQSDVDAVQIDITAVNDAPVNTVPGTQTVTEETSTAISGISVNDIDAGSGTLTTRLQVSNGVLNVTLSGSATISAGSDGSGDLTISGGLVDLNNTLATLTYTGNTDVVGTAADTLTVTTNDGGNTGSGGALSDVDTVQVDITAINDAPVNTVPGTQTVAEETATAISGISVSDVDAGSGALTTRLQVSSGVLNVTLSGSATISAGADGTGDLTISGSLADLNNTLAALTYTGSTDVYGTAADTLTMTTNDGGNTGSGGAQSDVDTVQIDITAVNDTPVVSGPGGALNATEQVGRSIHGTGFGVSDVDAASGTATATFTVGEGIFSITAGDSGVSVGGDNGTGTVTFTGSVAQLDALLTGASTGTITYTNTSDTPSASTTLVLTVNDGGNTGADPGLTADAASEEDSASVTLNITAVNDNPMNAGSLPASIAVTEDISSDVDLSLIDLSDVDAAGGSLTLTLGTSTGGLLSATSAGGVLVGGSGSDSLTLTGTQANLNSFLNVASNVRYLHGTPGTNGVNADTIEVEVSDNGNTGGGGGGTLLFGTVNVNIGAVNDAPVNTIPGTQVVGEETPTAISGVSVADVDAGSGALSTRLQVSSGVLNISLSGSATISSGSNGSSDLTVSGNLTDINNTLSSLTYTGNADITGAAADMLTVSTNDGGNTGSGGVMSDVDSVQINITPVNDTPVVTGPGSALNAIEQVGLSLEGKGFGVSDVDAASGEAIATFAVGEGVISIETGNSGVAVIGGNGTGSVLFSGTVSQLNALLTGGTTGTIIYTNPSDTPGISTTVTLTVNDRGNTGSDPGLTGGASSEQDSASAEINITAVNDEPTITGPLSVSVGESEAFMFSKAQGNQIVIFDPDVGAGTLSVTLRAVDGTLTLASTSGLTLFIGDGAQDSMIRMTGSLAAINNALNGLTYYPSNLLGGSDLLTISVSDGAGEGPAINSAQLSIEVQIPNTTDPLLFEERTPVELEDENIAEDEEELDFEAVPQTSDANQDSLSALEDRVRARNEVEKRFEDQRRDEPNNTRVRGPVFTEVEVNLTLEDGVAPEKFDRSQDEVLNEIGQAIQQRQTAELDLESDLRELGQQLDHVHENLLTEITFQSLIVGSVTTASISLTVGYAIWATRAGVLFASMLSSLPAWQSFDPLPVLGGAADPGRREGSESLLNMVNSGTSAPREIKADLTPPNADRAGNSPTGPVTGGNG
ncbi:cadherin-like domain-containing protein [Stratiformator vulcanicus]|uniref:RapA2 cadherin-like domain-containing protein n=1 Tax=Stratiformator vulcanicus TaxID=2527980 RepID=A0A517QW77_9PLAN|nr:cadherin-like domain-containing protein [Stratiformator vulcanicus]QDT35916.1 hypothetical protein Pan189_02690 [Stratiformator vulcanicus]